MECHRCKAMIVGDAVKVAGSTYHPNCFNCFYCQTPLTKFRHENNHAVCENCYEKMVKKTCSACGDLGNVGSFYLHPTNDGKGKGQYACSECAGSLQRLDVRAEIGKQLK